MNERESPLNVKQAAAYLGLKPSYIYNLVFYGKLTAYKPGGKRLIFKISDLEKYAYGNKIGDYSDRADAILNSTQNKKAENARRRK